MAGCNHENKHSASASCPECAKPGKPVARITVAALIQPEFVRFLDTPPYFFCAAPSCDVVYFSAAAVTVINNRQLRVRVGIKETEDPIPLCYCFNYDRMAIWQDIRATGATAIAKIITERIKAGECRCEVTNPSGGCCLGDVYQAVKQAKALNMKSAVQQF